MSLVKPAIVCGLIALIIGGCGFTPKPSAGSAHLSSHPGFFGQAKSLRTPRVQCLLANHLPVELYRTKQDLPAVRVGHGPGAPYMVFEPTNGYAEGLKLSGQAQGAELIGPVLLYPRGMGWREAQTVEQCAAAGLSG